MKKVLPLVMCICMTACSSGGGGNESQPPGNDIQPDVTGVVSAPSGILASLNNNPYISAFTNFLFPAAVADIVGVSPVANTTVELVRIDDAGLQVGAPLVSVQTDVNGLFEITTTESPSPNLLLRVGSGNAQMRAFYTSSSVDINPVSEYVADKIISEISSVQLSQLSSFTLSEIRDMLVLVASENIDLSGIVTVVDAKNHIETLIGNAVSSKIALALSDLSGEWTLRNVTLESNCEGDIVNTVYSINKVDIEQVDDSVTIDYGEGITTTAVLSGLELTDIALSSYPDGAGITTETAFVMSINENKTQINGELSWEWVSDQQTCNGRSQLVFTDVDLPTELEGSWQSACYSLSIGSPVSVVLTEVYQGSRYNYIARAYDNDICEDSPIVVKSGDGYVYFGDHVMANNDTVTAREIEVQISSTNIEGPTGEIANAVGYNTGDELFDLYYINGSRLYFGDYSSGNSGLTSIERPIDIAFDWSTVRFNDQGFLPFIQRSTDNLRLKRAGDRMVYRISGLTSANHVPTPLSGKMTVTWFDDIIEDPHNPPNVINVLREESLVEYNNGGIATIIRYITQDADGSLNVHAFGEQNLMVFVGDYVLNQTQFNYSPIQALSSPLNTANNTVSFRVLDDCGIVDCLTSLRSITETIEYVSEVDLTVDVGGRYNTLYYIYTGIIQEANVTPVGLPYDIRTFCAPVVSDYFGEYYYFPEVGLVGFQSSCTGFDNSTGTILGHNINGALVSTNFPIP